MLDILDMSQHNPFLFMVAGQGKLELFVLGWVETRTELNGGIIVKMKMVFCSAVVMALLSAPATAQYLPDIIGDDLAYVDSQWSTAGQAWNLYDLVVPGMATNGNSWGEAPFIDPEATGVSMWGPTTDMTGNGLPDQYELALGTALRYALDEEGGTLLFPEFKAQWDLNDKSVGRFNDDDLATWGGGGMTEPGEGGRSWTGQRRWYTILTTQSQEWEDFFQAGASYFTHASDNGAGSDGGPGCGSTFGGGCGPYPAREQNPFHATLGTPAGDADGDGISNLQEYLDNPTATPLEYALAAITPDGGGGGGFEDVILFKGFDGDDELVSGDFKGPFNFGAVNGESSHAIVAGAPFGGGTESLEYTMNADTIGTKGIALYVGQSNSVYDISAYSYVNFYVKAPASDRRWGFTLRERSGTVPSTSDAPRAQIDEAAFGTWDSKPGFVANEWSYISVPFASLTPTDGAPGSDPGFSGDFSLFTDLWMYTNTDIPAGDDQVVQFDHYTFSTTPEGGRLAVATEQNASASVTGVAGNSVCYDVTNPGTAGPGDFTWTFDDGLGGGPIALAGELDGQLCFDPLTEADAGTYVASFDDGDPAKVANTFTLNLEVLPAATAVPASTNWTLFITMLAILLSGAALMYGRKKGLTTKD